MEQSRGGHLDPKEGLRFYYAANPNVAGSLSHFVLFLSCGARRDLVIDPELKNPRHPPAPEASSNDVLGLKTVHKGSGTPGPHYRLHWMFREI